MSLIKSHRDVRPPVQGERQHPLAIAYDDEGDAHNSIKKSSGKLRLMDFPPEIHLLITKHLIYPDALSLKHTNRHFYGLVYTGVKLKVEWLVERRSMHLECPDQSCNLGSDLRFCRGSVP